MCDKIKYQETVCKMYVYIIFIGYQKVTNDWSMF